MSPLVDWTTIRGNLHLVATARNGGVGSLSTSTFEEIKVVASGSTIDDPNYAAFEDNNNQTRVVLQPGEYLIMGLERFGDASSNNCFAGVRVSGGGTTFDSDDWRIGNWGYSNNRLTIEYTRRFTFTTTAKIDFQHWASNTGMSTRVYMEIYRIGS